MALCQQYAAPFGCRQCSLSTSTVPRHRAPPGAAPAGPARCSALRNTGNTLMLTFPGWPLMRSMPSNERSNRAEQGILKEITWDEINTTKSHFLH